MSQPPQKKERKKKKTEGREAGRRRRNCSEGDLTSCRKGRLRGMHIKITTTSDEIEKEKEIENEKRN